MTQPQIVISILGGIVQDVYCSGALEDLVVVDWDVEQRDEGVVEAQYGRQTLRARVTHPIIWPLNQLAGSDVEAVIEAACERETSDPGQ
jgi:hypothetical protein